MVRLVQRAPCGDFLSEIARLHPTQNGRLDSTKAEVKRIALHLREREADRVRIAMRRQGIDQRTARITETEQLGDFVESLTGGIIPRLAQQAIDDSSDLSDAQYLQRRDSGCGDDVG